MAISRRQIIDSIHDGALAWSQRPGKGYEHGLVEEIAEQLCEHISSSGESIVYGNRYYGNRELTFGELRQLSGVYAEPRVDDNQRMDISLFNRKGRPICVIEVKTDWIVASINYDLTRVYQLVRSCSSKNGGSLRRGFIAVGRMKMSREGIDQIVKSFEELYRDVNIRYEVGRTSSLSIEMSARG